MGTVFHSVAMLHFVGIMAWQLLVAAGRNYNFRFVHYQKSAVGILENI